MSPATPPGGQLPTALADGFQPVAYDVDPTFADYFANVRQVFIYINDDCNLACKQCIYKPHVTYNEQREIPLSEAAGLLSTFHSLGARKVTFLGGEPTLYGSRSRPAALGRLISFAGRAGYDYLRLDTNGQFPSTLFERGGLTELDELAFSVDGYSPATSDLLRGEGTFRRSHIRINEARQLGIQTSITCCIHRDLIKQHADGTYGVDRVIVMARALGVQTINFHDLFKAGVPMDTWTGDFDTNVADYVAMYNSVRARVESGAYSGISVRLPQCFVTKTEFARNPRYYGYCPVKLAERVMIHSDGVIRICSNLICSSFGTGRFEGSQISWNRTASNETLHHDQAAATPCTNRSKNRSYGDYVPLCFSFKPNQQEPVWQEMNWDDRRTVGLTPPSGADQVVHKVRTALPVHHVEGHGRSRQASVRQPPIPRP